MNNIYGSFYKKISVTIVSLKADTLHLKSSQTGPVHDVECHDMFEKKPGVGNIVWLYLTTEYSRPIIHI